MFIIVWIDSKKYQKLFCSGVFTGWFRGFKGFVRMFFHHVEEGFTEICKMLQGNAIGTYGNSSPVSGLGTPSLPAHYRRALVALQSALAPG
jgi:hypothetical protein